MPALAKLCPTLNDGDGDLFQPESGHFGSLVQLRERFDECAMHLLGDHALGFTYLRAGFSHRFEPVAEARAVNADLSGVRLVASPPSRMRRRWGVSERIGIEARLISVGSRSDVSVRVPPRVIRSRLP
jgi:hypothetical protein